MSPRRARLALSLVCEAGDPRLPDLLGRLAPAELLAAIRDGRPLPGQSCPAAWAQAAQTLDVELDRTLREADAHGLRWLIPGDPAWPQHLDDLDHVSPMHGATGAPLGLWVRGKRRLADLAAHGVSVVGARDCSAYGAEVAAEAAADAASAGLTVVSGAAVGIDACAHRGALTTAGTTIAVLACDAATAYPRAHAALLERIAEDGLVVSEQPPNRAPTKARFLSRNRLIAALTAGTVVVEARRRSGALNTLAWADQLGRVTMAVPGPVTSALSAGTHQAIRDGKAVLVTNGTDVLAELAWLAPTSDGGLDTAPGPDSAFDRLPPSRRRVLDSLDWSEALDVGSVARRAGLDHQVTAGALADLSAAGWATVMPDGAWVLLRRADLER